MPPLFRAVSSLALAGLLTHCATSSGAGSAAASGDAVSLRFAWPEGFTTQVASTSTESQDGKPAETQGMDYQLRLEGKGEERKLRTEQVVFKGSPSPESEGAPPLTPTLVLGPQGQLRRVEGVEEVVAQMTRDAESQGIPEEQRQRLVGLVADAMEQSSRYRWAMLVGKWNGLTLKPGESLERPEQMTMPMFGSRVAVRERVTLKEWVPCTQGAAEKRCVRLVLESSLDPEKREQASADVVKQMKAFIMANVGMPESALPDLKVEGLRLDSTVEFIAEPDTLIPYRQSAAGSSQVVMVDAQDGEKQTFGVQSERLEVFTPAAR